MQKQRNFSIVKKDSGDFQFTRGEIAITVDQFTYDDGKHHIASPQKANADFECSGKRYSVDNTNGFSTVEDWYLEELLSKYQMLVLLLTTEPLY
jgi:hypothetical protein